LALQMQFLATYSSSLNKLIFFGFIDLYFTINCTNINSTRLKSLYVENPYQNTISARALKKMTKTITLIYKGLGRPAPRMIGARGKMLTCAPSSHGYFWKTLQKC